MTTAAAGIIGFGPQAAKDTIATEFYRHRAVMVDLDVVDEIREGAPEVGGSSLPTFPYKTGPVCAGGFTIQPRLEDTLGWLLYSVLGDYSISPDGDINDHTFSVSATDPTFVPWTSLRKLIPRMNGEADTDLGTIFKDCKALGAVISLVNNAPVTMRYDVLGRSFTLDHSPNLWSWENAFEDWQSIPVGCSVGGYLKLDSEEFHVIGANVGFQNTPGDINMMKIYGDPYLLDVEIVGRRMVYDLTCLWQNPEMYSKIRTGAVDGTTWSSIPYTASFEVKAVSSVNMPDETEPFSLVVAAPEVMMSQVGGVQLAGNQSIILRFQGVALETTAPEDYATFTLRNKATEYVWPVPGSGS